MRYDTIFFDLDGTLTDPAEGITNAVMVALRGQGIEPPADRRELYHFIGPPLVDTFREDYGFTDAQIRQAIDDFHDYFGAKGKFENALLPGAVELLSALKAAGRKVVLATSKPEIFARQILEHFGILRYFDGVFGATYDETMTRKADIIALALKARTDYGRIVMVGDRHHDIDGAAANGLPAIGVLCGFGSESELRTAGAIVCVSDLMALRELLLAP